MHKCALCVVIKYLSTYAYSTNQPQLISTHHIMHVHAEYTFVAITRKVLQFIPKHMSACVQLKYATADC